MAEMKGRDAYGKVVELCRCGRAVEKGENTIWVKIVNFAFFERPGKLGRRTEGVGVLAGCDHTEPLTHEVLF
jgi:hypothetical protein